MKTFRILRALALVLMIFSIALPAAASTSAAGNEVSPLFQLLPLVVVGLVINEATLKAIFTNFNVIFNEAVAAAQAQWNKIAMEVPSNTSIEEYDWLGAFPKMREWIGERFLKNLKDYSWQIKNKDWEATVAVPRNSIEDDRIGIYRTIVSGMGASAVTHVDDLVFGLLNAGFTAKGYDGKTFFATDHASGSNKASGGGSPLSTTSYPLAIAALKGVKDDQGNPMLNGTEPLILTVGPALEQTARQLLNNDYISVAGGSTQNNVWKGSAGLVVSPKITSATAWFLTADFNGLKPFIFQRRRTAQFVALQDPTTSDHVFKKKEFLFGTDSRDNAGYGLHQLAYGSVGA